MRRVLQEPSRARLIIAMMWSTEFSLNELVVKLESDFGPMHGRSDVYDFKSDYYQAEMGDRLRKQFICFANPVERDFLVEAKLRCTAFEENYARFANRTVNLDPMILTRENVVVATSKNFPNRVYLGRGVFGDLMLIRKKGGFSALPSTYEDYATHIDFFNQLWRDCLVVET